MMLPCPSPPPLSTGTFARSVTNWRWPVGATVSLSGYDRRHLADLVALAPTDAELDASAAWVRYQDGGDIDLLLHAVLARVRSAR